MLTPNDIRGVFNFYTLGTPIEILQAIHGYVNETAIVRTTRGRYVMRRNHRRFTEPLLRYRHAVMSWLYEHQVPVPALVAARDGSTLLQFNQRFYEVHTYIESEPYDPCQPEQRASIGAVLARYHEAIRGFPTPLPQNEPRYNPWSVDALITQLIERDVMGDLQDLLAWYSSRAAQLRSELSDTVYRSLPHLIIHGDIHSDNLRFYGNQVAALLDFDQISWDARLVDLADALVAFASEPLQEPSWGVFVGALEPQCATELLGAYAEQFPLTLAETVALPTVIELLWLQGELGRVRSTPEGAPEYHRSVLYQGRMLSTWMASHRQALVATWGNAGTGTYKHQY